MALSIKDPEAEQKRGRCIPGSTNIRLPFPLQLWQGGEWIYRSYAERLEMPDIAGQNRRLMTRAVAAIPDFILRCGNDRQKEPGLTLSSQFTSGPVSSRCDEANAGMTFELSGNIRSRQGVRPDATHRNIIVIAR